MLLYARAAFHLVHSLLWFCGFALAAPHPICVYISVTTHTYHRTLLRQKRYFTTRVYMVYAAVTLCNVCSILIYRQLYLRACAHYVAGIGINWFAYAQHSAHCASFSPCIGTHARKEWLFLRRVSMSINNTIFSQNGGERHFDKNTTLKRMTRGVTMNIVEHDIS